MIYESYFRVRLRLLWSLPSSQGSQQSEKHTPRTPSVWTNRLRDSFYNRVMALINVGTITCQLKAVNVCASVSRPSNCIKCLSFDKCIPCLIMHYVIFLHRGLNPNLILLMGNDNKILFLKKKKSNEIPFLIFAVLFQWNNANAASNIKDLMLNITLMVLLNAVQII